jgi:chromosome segregation ATPase
MSTRGIVARVIIILGLAVLGASVGICFQALRITGKPQEFCSLAKLVAGGGNITKDIHMRWRESQMDFYGTIIETLESAEMKRRALERVRALNPDLKESDVDIRVTQSKGSAIFNILANGTEPKYTRIFLDALLDEFITFRQQVRESQGGKTLQPFLQAVVAQQKKMDDSMAMLEKVRARVDTLSAKSELERLVTRLNTLRNQRDDLRLELKPMDANDADRAPLEAKLTTTGQGIQAVEAELQRHEPGISELRVTTEKYETDKQAYEKLFEEGEKIQARINTIADYVINSSLSFALNKRFPPSVG